MQSSCGRVGIKRTRTDATLCLLRFAPHAKSRSNTSKGHVRIWKDDSIVGDRPAVLINRRAPSKFREKGKKEEEVGGRGIDDPGQVLTCAVAEENCGDARSYNDVEGKVKTVTSVR